MDYESLKVGVSERLIRENGKIAYIVTPNNTGPDYDPVIGEPTRELVYFLETQYSMTNRDKSLVEVGDIMGLVSTETGATPIQSINKIEIDGVLYNYIDVRPLNPGGVVMLYKIHCRK